MRFAHAVRNDEFSRVKRPSLIMAGLGCITADARIVPVWTSAGLIAPEPWNPWLDGGERDAARNGRSRETRELALAG